MEKANLKDGRIINIDIWDNVRLQQYINAEDKSVKKTGSTLHYEKFGFFGPNFVKKRYNEKVLYSNEKHLSPLEKQDIDGITNADYDRNIIAIFENDIIGISSFMWSKERYTFWQYYHRIIDVKEDWKNIGVGTNLIKRLNNHCFMWGKIFMKSNAYETEGRMHIKHVIDREITGKHFAVVPSGYFPKNAPTKPGIYNSGGKPIEKKLIVV